MRLFDWRYISKLPLILLAIIVVMIACTESYVYKKDHKSWQKQRFDELKKYDGWPAVIGLYWLKKGVQFFGSSKQSNEIIWPIKVPLTIGRFDLEGDSVVMWAYGNLGLKINGEDKNTCLMIPDTTENKTMVNWNNYYWYLIKRQERYGVRLIDTLSERRMNLQPISSFPVDQKWAVQAKFVKPDSGETVQYKNIVGMEFNVSFAGYLQFEIDGIAHQLIALNGGEDEYFVIIADETTGESTYGGGRYIYPKIANQEGFTTLDFNKAINPPCVFTDFATCPLPPKENRLPFALTAGEKFPDNNH